MTDYIAALSDPRSPYFREAHKLAINLAKPEHRTIEAGIIRWVSNGSVPPADCVALAAHIGQPVDVAACTAARDAETRETIARYREAQKGRQPSGEELSEMRAAFGPGTTVVNALTGRRTRL